MVAFSCAAVLAVTLSACNASLTPWAARAGGSTVSQSQLDSALSAIAANTGYRCLIGAGAGGTVKVQGAGEGTYSSAFTAEVLSILVQNQVVHTEVDRLGLSEPASLVSVAGQQLTQAFSPTSGSACASSGAAVIDAFPASYRSQLLQFQVDQDVLAAHLAGADLGSGLAAYEASHPGTLGLSCLSVILVKSRTEASSLRTRLRGGTSFASLARRYSIDTQSAASGGEIRPCLTPGQLTAPLGSIMATLAVGQVSAPISFRGDTLLMLVTSRQPQPFAQVVATLLSNQQAALSLAIQGFVRAAQVQVNPQYGTWSNSHSIAGVTPPVAPAAALVPNPAAASAG